MEHDIRKKSRCDVGFTGVVCAVCEDGFYLSDEHCLPCPKSRAESQAIIVLVFGALLLVFLVALCRTMHVKDSKAHWRRASRTFSREQKVQRRKFGSAATKKLKAAYAVNKRGHEIIHRFCSNSQCIRHCI